jgi:Na+/proline symporter
LGGISGKFTNIFNLEIFLTFGIAISISLLSGATIDQQLWQRAFSIKKGNERKAFYFGAVIFLLVPLLLSLLGFIAANKTLNISVSNSQLAGYTVILNYLPPILILIFILTLMVSLFAAGASALCAASSIFTVDVYSSYINPNSSKNKKLAIGKISMILILILGILIAVIPNIQIIYLMLLIGTVRGALIFPTIMAIYKKNVSSKGFFVGSVMGILIGLPIFIAGTLLKKPILSAVGAILSVSISAIIVMLSSKLKILKDKNV